MIFYTGSYTEGSATGGGVGCFSLDEKGQMVELAMLEGLANPSYLMRSKSDRSLLFATCEAGSPKDEVASIRLGEEGDMTVLSTQQTNGADGCHVLVHGEAVYTSSYGGGVVTVFPLKEDRIEPAVQAVKYEMEGLTSRAHQACPSPDGKRLYVCDLGCNVVWVHDLLEGGRLSDQEKAIILPEGTGPRHMLFHPHMPVAYLIGEVSNELLVADWDKETGKLTLRESHKCLPDGAAKSSGAAIRLHPSNRAVYTSHRGADLIAGFAIEDDGALKKIGTHGTEGKAPRDFNIDPAGHWVVVAHQKSNTLVSFSINQETLMPEGEPACVLECGAVVCVEV